MDLGIISVEGGLELLLKAKQLQIFSESDIYSDGTDWNLDELSLGDIGIALPVTVFDDGKHDYPLISKRFVWQCSPYWGHWPNSAVTLTMGLYLVP